jgi:hypothetical protein
MNRTTSFRSTLLLACAAVVLPAWARAGDSVEVARGHAPHHPQQPQLAIDAEGTVHLAFGAGNTIRYSRSSDRGQTFSEPVELPGVPSRALGKRRGPRLAVTGRTLCVTAIGGPQGHGRDGDLLAWKSLDGGKSWTKPVAVNDAPNSAREGLHALAAGAGQRLFCTWLDLRTGRTEVWASRSDDGGGTWEPNVLVYKSPDGSVCECCHPGITVDASGRVHVQWRNALNGNRDIYLASSANHGQSFGRATKLGHGSWPLDACPMDGGAVAAAGGRLTSVWRRGTSVYLAVVGDGDEQRLGAGEQPWIAATPAGPFVVWLARRGAAVYLHSPHSPGPLQLAAQASDPVIACGPGGEGPVVAAWESHDGSQRSIRCQVIAR